MTQNQTISPTIAIVGLGYVGLPLALAFAKQYTVIGFDINFVFRRRALSMPAAGGSVLRPPFLQWFVGAPCATLRGCT